MLRAMSTLTDVVLDPAAAYPEVTPLRSALAARDWRGCRAVLDAADPVARTSLTVLGGDLPDLEDFLREVLRADPDDGAAAAMLGSHLTQVGWKVRSGARARYVSQDQFSVFHDWLRKAEQVLLDGAARNPDDPAIWTARMPTARGLEMGQSEVRRRYDRLARADQHHLPGQRHLLQQLCPKWGGTWEKVHGFARESMLAAPPGSHTGVLVAEAHIEHWLELDAEADLQYLRSPQVMSELHEAGRLSVWNPNFRRTYGWVAVMSTF